MYDDSELSMDMFAMAVGELQNGLSLTMLSLSSILEKGSRHGILTSEDYSVLQKDSKIYAKSATSVKATLNLIYEKLVNQNSSHEVE